MGAGPIGCELAQSFQRLGSQVTLIDMADRVLPKEDADVSALLADVLRGEGIDVLTSHKAVRFEVGAQKRLIADNEGVSVEIPFDEVIVAVGRRAHTESLGLAELGIGLNRDGTVVVDEYLRTGVPNIFACGDVAGPYQFTHMASHQAWYAAVNALFRAIPEVQGQLRRGAVGDVYRPPKSLAWVCQLMKRKRTASMLKSLDTNSHTSIARSRTAKRAASSRCSRSADPIGSSARPSSRRPRAN